MATVPSAFVHWASLLGEAHVLRSLLHGSLEEALAALAGTHAVMLAGCCVATNGAKLTRAGWCSLVAGSASGRGRAHGTACATSATGLRGLCAANTVNKKGSALKFVGLE